MFAFETTIGRLRMQHANNNRTYILKIYNIYVPYTPMNNNNNTNNNKKEHDEKE